MAMQAKGSKESSDAGILSGLVRHRTNMAPLAPSEPFLRPPIDPAGRVVDCSDRLLICSSSNMRNEVVVGGSDHALYAININDQNSRHITMYGKSNGHTDWVTTVTHLANGKVLSGAMDGKLCLWSERVRSQCVELQNNSTHPISKVVSDTRYNVAMSCSYDGTIAVWGFGNETAEAKPSSHAVVRGGMHSRTAAPSPQHVPISYMAAHSEPVLECGYRGDVFVSGDKGGSLIVWDLAHCKPKTRFRAHPGPITAVDCAEDRSTIISCGTDGFVKIWDPRAAGSGLVQKIPAHVQPTAGGVGGSGSAVPSVRGGTVTTSGPGGRGRTSLGGRSSTSRAMSSASAAPGRGPSRSSGPPAGGAGAISCMAVTTSRGSSADMCYIVTGSGSPSDSSLAVIDVRQGFRPVSRWDHHRNGVYSLCAVGDQCILSGDGMGTLLSHNLLASELEYPRSCLKYGIGASEQGAVRAIQCINGKVVTAGEDGNVIIFDYDAGMFAS